MKKIVLIGILLCLGFDNLLADFKDQTACSKNEIKWLTNDKRYVNLGVPLQLGVSETFINAKTMKIDRAKKTIDVEVMYLSTYYKRSLMSHFPGYGLDRGYIQFNYEKRTRKSTHSEYCTCNGDIIDKVDYSDIGEDNLPEGSLDTSAMDAIVKIYKLK